MAETTPAGRVVGLWRYPVKSLRGELLSKANVRVDGIEGDREWAIESRTSGRILSAKRFGQLLQAEATTQSDGGASLKLPGGVEVRAGTEECDAALSDWLEEPVVLRRRSPGRRARFDATDISGSRPRSFEIETEPGQFMDTKSPLHLLTTASLQAAAALVPDADWDVTRFRPNLLIDVPTDGFPEDRWINCTLHVSDLQIWVRREATRCRVPTLAQPGLAEDPRILRALIDNHENSLGVRAHPVRPGTVEVGAGVTLLAGTGPPSHLRHLERPPTTPLQKKGRTPVRTQDGARSCEHPALHGRTQRRSADDHGGNR